MAILIFAVLLTIVQAAPPVPGKTANQPTRSGQNVKRNPSNQQNTPDAPIPSASEGDQHEGKPQGSHNARETVIIREPAPVSRKDGWDKAYVVATCLLVVVGGLAVKYAIKTLRAIEQQGRNMEKSVKIAESNAETAKDTVAAMHEANRNNLISLRTVQRPYIAPHLADMSEWIVTAFQKEAGLDHWLFQFPIKNRGNTPAIAVSAHTNVRTFTADSGMPPDFDYPNYGTVGGHFPDILAAGGKTYGQFKIPHNFAREIYEKKKVLYFYGWIEYRDVFQGADEAPHRTEYCYRMTIVQIAEPTLIFNLARHHEHNKQT